MGELRPFFMPSHSSPKCYCWPVLFPIALVSDIIKLTELNKLPGICSNVIAVKHREVTHQASGLTRAEVKAA